MNTVLQIDAALKIGQSQQSVEVNDSLVTVQISDTEIGQTIASQQVVGVPLNGRSYTDLLEITEGKTLKFRFEAFNAFNHAQFYPNGSVDGDINDARFGHVLKSAPARIGQVALKFNF